MTEAWVPGAECVRAERDGGAPLGGAPRVVWHTTESDASVTSALAVALELNHRELQAHLVWNPTTGDIVQMIPAIRAALGLRGGEGVARTNREGRVCIQIEVVGYAAKPFTGGPLRGLERILGWLDSWGVPRRWPAGSPLAEHESHAGGCTRGLWSRGGHFGHSQVPGNLHTDPGAIDACKLTEPPRQSMRTLPRQVLPPAPLMSGTPT